MERAATTASSLEAEQDSEAQSRFEAVSKQSNDPPFSRVNTLGSGEDSMKLIELMEHCTTLSKLFWAKAKVKTVNGERQLQALVDKKNVIITETSIRSDLKLEDAGGTDYLPTATIFEKLARIGYEKPSPKLTFYKAFFSPQWKFLIHTITQYLSAKTTAWNEFSSTMASAIICLATNQNLTCPMFINQQLGDMSHYKKTYVNPSHTKKIFANMKREGKDFSRRTPIISQPSSSKPQKKKSRRKQRKDNAPTEPTAEATPDEAHVSTPSYDPCQSGEDRMQLHELMNLCTKLSNRVLALDTTKSNQALEIESLKKRVKNLEKRKKSRTSGLKRLRKIGLASMVESSNDARKDDAEKKVSAADPVTTTGEVVTTVNAPTTTIDELTLAQTLIEIKAAKPKAVTFVATTTTTTRPKDRGVVVQEPKPEVPLKKKDQITMDVEVARNLEAQLQAELEEEERLARQNKEEANVALLESWDYTQAMIDANFQLA
ncbi:hypothetical protein Tco_0006787 [Tanacetum coccineum]